MRTEMIETIKRMLNENKEMLYSSGIITAAFIFSLAVVLFKEDRNVSEDAEFLMLLAGFVFFSCICACIIYRKKTEEYLTVLLTDLFKVLAAATDATMLTMALFIVIAILFEGIPVISYSLLVALAVLTVILFIASISSVVIFSVMAD